MRHVSLRSFTVYGAWGRPDMAAYKFADKILNGESVSAFYAKPAGGPLASSSRSSSKRNERRSGSTYDQTEFGISYEIDVFDMIVCNFSGSVMVELDFTYVTDVVDGITAAMSYRPRRCDEVFNLGRGHPEPLTSLNELSLPPTELLQTYADISHSKQALGYNPKISLAEDSVRQ
ncbi:uncharacterized protein LOC134180057 [Corticium candelabrum]|uniref:uncharacterized protein LOC134180057 n=1 Tax=Corticium candelabrum TaxID=121492 RepID=UPI002E25E716|nr:uncharacterized protein LOC134180057 [Corticium candelabrum]